MLKNVLSNVKTYVDQHKQLEVSLNETKNKIFARYKDGAFLEKFEQVNAIYLEGVNKLYNDFKGKVEDEFKEAEKAIRSVAMMPIPQEIINSMTILEQIKNPTDEEIKSVFEATNNCYLACKKAHDVFKVNGSYARKVQAYLDGETEIEPIFIPMDPIIEEITNVRDYVMGNIFNASTSEFANNSRYGILNVLNGSMIKSLEETANNFYDRYKA